MTDPLYYLSRENGGDEGHAYARTVLLREVASPRALRALRDWRRGTNQTQLYCVTDPDEIASILSRFDLENRQDISDEGSGFAMPPMETGNFPGILVWQAYSLPPDGLGGQKSPADYAPWPGFAEAPEEQREIYYDDPDYEVQYADGLLEIQVGYRPAQEA